MNQDKKPTERKTTSDDNVSNNAHYSESGEITRDDDRDRKNSTDDWDAEHNRTGRHK
jgi:YD repeat-containing protein